MLPVVLVGVFICVGLAVVDLEPDIEFDVEFDTEFDTEFDMGFDIEFDKVEVPELFTGIGPVDT